MTSAAGTPQAATTRVIAAAFTTPDGEPVSTGSKTPSSPNCFSDISAVGRDLPVTSAVGVSRSRSEASAEATPGNTAQSGRGRSHSPRYPAQAASHPAGPPRSDKPSSPGPDNARLSASVIEGP